jgi:Ser/Thr protein kinase RdoA (MazF antagonist)
VYGCRLRDGREVAVKVHRPGADLQHLDASAQAQRRLADAGYPCPTPLHGPTVRDGRAVVVESLLPRGEPGDGTDADVRRALAVSLAHQVELLRGVPAAPLRAGAPAWAQYEQGPWPTPHDPLFDFGVRPARFGWLDDLATAAARCSEGVTEPDAVGHSDWCVGNVLVGNERDGTGVGRAVVSAAYDWDSLAGRPEPVLVGLGAGSYTLGGAVDAAPTVEQVAAFVDDYSRARAVAFTGEQRAAAAAAACWVMAYNARCEVCVLADDADPAPGSSLRALQLAGRSTSV